MTKAFLDTNIVVYAFSEDPRNRVAEDLLNAGGDISVQVLNEFASVARRKLGYDWPELTQALEAVRTLARAIHPVDLETHTLGVRLAERYGLAVYDGMIVAAALLARCDIVFSEDLHDGLEIDGRLRIVNPFAST